MSYIAEDLNEHLIEKIRISHFAIQMDEATALKMLI
jgi:hypothetical protein